MTRFAIAIVVLLRATTAHAFEVDGHFYLTYVAASLAGMSHEQSLRVATAAQAVDESAGSQPLPRFNRGDGLRLQTALPGLHSFSKGEGTPDQQRASVELQHEILYARARDHQSLDRFGVYIHAIGDSYAHRHGKDYIRAIPGQVACAFPSHGGEHDGRPRIVNPFRHGKEELKGVLDVISHALPEMHSVDKIGFRPDQSNAMVIRVYEEVRRYASETGLPLAPPIDHDAALRLLGSLANEPAIRYAGDVDGYAKVLNGYLRENGVTTVTVPRYSGRAGLVVTATGDVIDLRLSKADLFSDAVLPPPPSGAREDHAMQEMLFEVRISDSTIASPMPPSMEQELRLDALAREAAEKGVRISYDRDSLIAALGVARAMDDPEADKILARVRETTGPVVAIDGKLVAVPLSRVTTSLGIGRVVGYVVDEQRNDIVLLGYGDGAGLTLDDLTIVLDSVWRRGAVPLVSLDPAPGRPFGSAFVTRVEGIPRDSRFGKVMLDADYDMKRINMGLLATGVPSMTTVYAYQLQHATVAGIANQATEGHLARFWLTPIGPRPGDIRVSPGGRVVLFASHVQQRTEVMLEAEHGLVGTQRADPLDEKGAAEFTAHYAELAARHPRFAELQALFDLTLMAGLLREHAPSHAQLARLANRTTAPVTIRDSDYPVLRNGGTKEHPFYTGGVHVAFTDATDATAELRGHVPQNIDELLRAPPVSGASSSNVHFLAALERFWDGQAAIEKRDARAREHFQDAESKLSAAIADDPELVGAYLVRGYVRILYLANIDGGLADCRHVIARQPELARAYTYLAMAHFRQARPGESASFAPAVSAATLAIERAPNDADAHGVRGMARLLAANTMLGFDYRSGVARLPVLDEVRRAGALPAIADFERALARERRAELRVQWRTWRGWARVVTGDLEGGRSELGHAELSRDAPALALRAAAAFIANDLDAAELAATQSLALEKLDAAHRIRAAIRFNRGDRAGAAAELRAAEAIQASGDPETARLIEDLER